MIATRGERNNNPGNIDRSTIRWEGMSADQSSDDRFIVFQTPQFGIRALAKILLNYQDVHNLDTIRQIIDRWAPPSENDTGAYVTDVAADVGVGPDDKIDLNDAAILTKLVTAIIRHENGRVIYSETMISGVAAEVV